LSVAEIAKILTALRRHNGKSASQAPQPQAAAETHGETDAGCLRSRKKLWVDGEGWIIRRVTTCY
jgi:hypothetical protein